MTMVYVLIVPCVLFAACVMYVCATVKARAQARALLAEVEIRTKDDNHYDVTWRGMERWVPVRFIGDHPIDDGFVYVPEYVKDYVRAHRIRHRVLMYDQRAREYFESLPLKDKP